MCDFGVEEVKTMVHTCLLGAHYNFVLVCGYPIVFCGCGIVYEMYVLRSFFWCCSENFPSWLSRKFIMMMFIFLVFIRFEDDDISLDASSGCSFCDTGCYCLRKSHDEFNIS